MMTSSASTLNPFASSFIPSTSLTAHMDPLPTKVMAQILIQEFVKDKRRRGEKDVTKSELVLLVEKIICAHYGVNSGKDILAIKTYISAKLSQLIPSGALGFKGVQRRSNIRYRFDMSVVSPLKPINLLGSFWGLNRYEQALSPTLVLPLRPEALKDKVWSVQDDDLKIWNPCLVKKCTCPPMFGYSVPPEFFGNPFHLANNCSVQSIHICHYPENSVKDGISLPDIYEYYVEDLEPLKDDYEDKINKSVDLEIYLEQMKAIVAGVCNLFPEEESTEYENYAQSAKSFYENFEISMDSFWDSDPSTAEVITEVEEDINSHCLLEDDEPTEKGVFEDEIPQWEECDSTALEDSTLATGMCDPPCSAWCKSGPKLERSDSVISSSASSVINSFKDTTNFLWRTCHLVNNEETIGKPDFKRSYSANECDPFYNSKFKVNCKAPYVSPLSEGLVSFKESPVTPLKRLDSWDSDSGVASPWSSEDIFDSDEESEASFEGPAKMWTVLNSEDSLWKPLPECTIKDQHAKTSLKRVHLLKRQKSES